MANFKIALKITGGNEGYISNDPDDRGGFTFCGIASAYWPSWPGFPIVKKTLADNNGNVHAANVSLKNNATVQGMVDEFYKANFWDVNKLDSLNNQPMANSLYDFGVNSGTSEAAKLLQRAAGVNDDGVIGQQTITAVNNANPETLYDAFQALRKSFYEELATKPGQHQFLSSWLSRLVSYQEQLQLIKQYS